VIVASLLPYFGGKRTLAPRIVAELGPHSAYWEPFCGSMAVLLAKPPCAMETVNDLNGDLINLARVIKDRDLGPMLYRRLRRTLMSETFMGEAAARWKAIGRVPAPTTPDLDRAEDFFYSSWAGRNGVTGTQSYHQGFARRFTKNGGHAAKRWEGAVASIPAFRDRMRRVTILSDDAFKLLPKIEDSEGVVIYLDPPYVVKGGTYVHDFDPADHARLAEAASRFTKTRVVVSYYEHPTLRKLYPADRWTWVECPTTKAMVNQGMRNKTGAVKAPEVLIINGPSFTAEGGLLA